MNPTTKVASSLDSASGGFGIRQKKVNATKIDGRTIFAHFKDYYKCSADGAYGLTDDDNWEGENWQKKERKISIDNLLGTESNACQNRTREGKSVDPFLP